MLAEHFDSESNCLYNRYIAKEAELTEVQSRRAVRSLARKGYAKLERGLMDEDGMVAGSGYRATFEGALLVRACVDCFENVADMTDGRCNLCWNNRPCAKCGRPYREHKLVGGYRKDFVEKEEPQQCELEPNLRNLRVA